VTGSISRKLRRMPRRPRSPRTRLTTGGLLIVALALGCRRDSERMHSDVAQEVPSAQDKGEVACGHAACGDDYLIDLTPDPCTVDTGCRIAIRLVATGDYHINDEYPHKFVADDAAGIEFLGTDPGGKNVFSKVAGNWTKSDSRTAAMVVTYKPADTQTKTVSGVLKFSVCSPQNCELDRRQVNASVQARR
jgi:hypothetical protein